MTPIIKVLAAVFVFAAGAAGEQWTAQQLKARFPYDLGADSVDVSHYPDAQQKNYKVFEQTCSKCHTLARPINSPMITQADWRRYVARMRKKGMLTADKGFGDEQATAVVDFLAYDSNVRKVQGSAAFKAESARLKGLFAQVKAARSKQGIKDDQQKVKPYGDDTMASPRP